MLQSAFTCMITQSIANIFNKKAFKLLRLRDRFELLIEVRNFNDTFIRREVSCFKIQMQTKIHLMKTFKHIVCRRLMDTIDWYPQMLNVLFKLHP